MLHQSILTTLSPADLQAIITNAVADGITEGMARLQQAPPEELLPREEAARFLHISLVTLNRRMKNGDLRFRQMGRRILFSKAELLAATTNKQKKGGLQFQ